MDKWSWVALAIYLFCGAMIGCAGFYSAWVGREPRKRAILAILFTALYGIIPVLLIIYLVGKYIIELGYALITGKEL